MGKGKGRASELRRFGSPSTLREFEYAGSEDVPEGCYNGHDLPGSGMDVYSVGRTPREAIAAFCKARLGEFGDDMAPLEGGDEAYTWGFRFTADGTSCKAAGIHVPGGVILTWWK